MKNQNILEPISASENYTYVSAMTLESEFPDDSKQNQIREEPTGNLRQVIHSRRKDKSVVALKKTSRRIKSSQSG